MKLQNDWKEYEKKETQAMEEFNSDIRVLEEMWLEKLDSVGLY